jgi:hypothetical protein
MKKGKHRKPVLPWPAVYIHYREWPAYTVAVWSTSADLDKQDAPLFWHTSFTQN